jgi:lipid-binding SYLF domain-containing protein
MKGTIMIFTKQYARVLLILAVAAMSFLSLTPASAGEKAVLVQDANAALKSLYGNQPAAKALGEKAAGVLVFPNITRAGFIVGGSGGDGVLYKKGKVSGYYNSGSASVGLQAGLQTFGYAVFFMTEAELKNFQHSSGWDIGTAPTVVLVDAGAAKDMNTMTLKSDIYAFIFNQEGLMAGLSLQGQKISKIK